MRVRSYENFETCKFLFFSIIFNIISVKRKSVVTVADAHRPPEKVLVLINALALPGPLIGKNDAVCSSSSSKFLVCTPCYYTSTVNNCCKCKILSFPSRFSTWEL